MLQHRRRKKPPPSSQHVLPATAVVSASQRPAAQHGGIRSVELSRGRRGYGFTVSGQRPCTLSCIVPGSPADAAGLHDGDQLLAVNGTAVAQLSHEHVVCLVASSADNIKLLLADGVRRDATGSGERAAKVPAVAAAAGDWSDTSDEYDDTGGYGTRPAGPGHHTPRHRPRSQSQTKLAASGRARSQSPGSALLQQRTSADARRTRSGLGKPRRAAPSPACAAAAAPSPCFPAAAQTSGGKASDFGVSAMRSFGSRPQRTDGDGVFAAAATSVASAAAASATFYGGRTLPRSTSVPDVSRQDDGDCALTLRSKEGRASALAAGRRQQQQLLLQGLRAIVGYIGTIEIPTAGSAAGARGGAGGALQLQAVRSAVRRLRVEQKVHTLVLLNVDMDGVRLRGPAGNTVAHYPRHALVMCGAYCDDERFFSLVTAPDVANNVAGDERYYDGDEEERGCSCHVFMVDPALSQHRAHVKVVQQFGGLGCCKKASDGGGDGGFAGDCLEFPSSCAPILQAISALPRDVVGTAEVPKGWPAPFTAAVPTGAPTRECLASGTDTDSDSGLGRHSRVRGSKASPSEAYVVSVDIPAEVGTAPSGARGGLGGTGKPAGGPSPLTKSRADGSSSGGSSSSRSARPRAANATAASANLVGSTGHGSPQQWQQGYRVGAVTSAIAAATSVSPAVFNIRAKADDSPLSQRCSADSLRRNMHRLMEARKTLVKDTHSLSDTESLASVRSTGSSFAPATISSPGNSDSSRATSSAASRSAVSLEPPLPSSRSSSSRLGAVATAAATSRQLSSSCETLSMAVASTCRPGCDWVDGKGRQLDRAAAVANDVHRSYLGSAPVGPESTFERSVGDRQHSKLSPRAYPELATRRAPSVVRLSECSAFDKVTSHDATDDGSSVQQQQQQRVSLNVVTAETAARVPKPVPAPRNAPSRPVLSTMVTTSGRTPVPETVAASDVTRVGNGTLLVAAASLDPRCSSVPPASTSVAATAGKARAIGLESVRTDVAGRQSVTGAAQLKLNSALAQLSKRWLCRVGGSLRRPCPRPATELAYAESLIDPQHGGASTAGSFASGSSGGAGTNGAMSAGKAAMTVASTDIGRVTRWALGLDKLLQDESGIAVFTDFLRKEHSEENIAFWLACEKFRRAPQQEKLGLAKEIFHNHLSPRGTQAVNVDSTACQCAEERLAAPTEDMFDEAQKQVFQLMKMDCYARFLKSDLYKNCIVADMEEHRLSGASIATASAQVFKDDASEESSDASETRRRRSLLLFLKESAKTLSRNADALSRTRSSDADALLKKQSAEQQVEHEKQQRPNYFRRAGTPGALPAAADLGPHSVREQADVIIVQSSSEDDGPSHSAGIVGRHVAAAMPRTRPQQHQPRPRTRRFVMPDGSTAEVDGAELGSNSMRAIVERLCAVHGVTMASVEVLAVGSDKPLDLNKKLSEMDSDAEFIMERRAVFRLELPRGKSVAMRAKPQRLVLDVLRPQLHKHGYNLSDVILYLDGQALASDSIVSTIDGRRISVHERGNSEDWTRRARAHRSVLKASSAGGAPRPRPAGAASSSGDSCSDQYCSSDGSGVDDVVDFEKAAFEERIKGGGLLGRLRPASAASDDRGQKAKKKNKNKVRFATSKAISPTSPDDEQHGNGDDGSHLLDLITRAQGTQYNDQRGARVRVGELPAFLLQPSGGLGRGSVPHGEAGLEEEKVNQSSRGIHQSRTDVQRQQLLRGVTSPLPPSALPSHEGALGGGNELPDGSFIADGHLPTHEQAEALFDTARPDLDGGLLLSAAAAGDAAVSDDDDRTPTRQPQKSSSSYRAELAVAKVGSRLLPLPTRDAGCTGSAGDQSWYRPHWDAMGVGGDAEDDCETEVSVEGEDDYAAAAGAFDPDRTLTAADTAGTDGSSVDLPMAGYLPPPSPFENASETTSSGSAVAALATTVATPSRPSMPPPYNMAVARSHALATVAGGAAGSTGPTLAPVISTLPSAATSPPTGAMLPSAATLQPAAAGRPAALPTAAPSAAALPSSQARPSRSSTLPGSRLSYASRPLIVDDDDELAGSSGRVDGFVNSAAPLLREEVAVSVTAAASAAEAFKPSGGLVHAVPLPIAEYGGRMPLAHTRPVLGGTAAHLLPQYGFYRTVQSSSQQAGFGGGNPPAHHGGLTVFGAAAVQGATGSKITFV